MKQVRYFLQVLLFICTSFYAHAQQPAYNSLLWEISGGGLSKPSYLYGTMHVSKKIAFNLSDTFFIALKKADVVSLEFDPDTWMKEMADDGELFQQEPRYLENGFSLYDAFALDKIDEDAYKFFLSRDHYFANGLLYRNSDDKDFEENTYLDMFIFQAGKKMGKTIVGLENHQFVRNCSYEAQKPYVGKKSGSSYYRSDNWSEIEKAYRKGNLSDLDSINTIMYEYTYFRKYMLDIRNEKMVEKLDSLYKTGKSVFTGVGAAHLPGNMGMIEMLRRKGYTVRAVNQKSTDYSIQSRTTIEKTFIPVSYTHQVAPDSLFEIDLPGNLYVINNKNRATEYFFPEMANGTYYSIVKFNTFAPLFKKSVTEQATTIDELLYENIPGKIIKKEIKHEKGYSLITILNQTRKGDYQRYKIFVYPTEIIIGKLAGTGDYALGKDGERFLTSFNILSRTLTQPFKTPGLSLPLGNGQLKETFSLYPLTYQSISKAEIYTPDSSYNFILSACFTDFEYIEEDSFELAYLTERFASSLEYTVNNSKEQVLNGQPLYKAVLKKQGATDIHTRLLIHGPHYILLGVMGKDSSNIDTYINQLRFSYDPVKQPVTFTDTAFFFTTKTSKSAVAFNSKKAKLSPDIRKNSSSDYSRYMSESIYFRDTTGNDKIEIYYKKFNDYTYYQNLDAFWKERSELIADNSLVIHSQKKEQKDSIYTMEVELRDTNSVRCVYWKYYLLNSSYYCLCYNTDTLTKKTPFVNQFFDNFQITKTYSTKSLFEQKKTIFFQDIQSDDSLKVTNAYKATSYMEFDEKDLDSINKLIEQGIPHAEYLKKNNLKSMLIRAVGNMNKPEGVAYLKKVYKENPDSIQVQSDILNALASSKSVESYLCIQDLLTQDVPYLSSYEVNRLFISFYDSLELSVKLFPKILRLTRYSNYRDNIYKLMAVMLDKKLLKKSVLHAAKTDILNDANEEIKEKLSTKSSYDSYSSSSNNSRYKSLDEIEAYIIILSYMQKEPAAKLFYSRVSRVPNKYQAMKYAVKKLHYGIPIEDSIIYNYSKNEALRADLYDALKTINRLDLFDKTYLNQATMAKSVLYAQCFNMIENDSIVFLEKRFINTKGNQDGYVYFYKRFNKDRRGWVIDYTGIQPTDLNTFETDVLRTKKGQKLKSNTEKEISTSIDNIMLELALIGRERNDYSYYDYGYDYADE